MVQLTLERKLAILSDAAKYDASCASSGSRQRDSLATGGIGSVEGGGICHSYAPDGRCISLLKILLTNACNYDCLYCVNRATSNVPRARFTVDEVVKLTIDLYRRNYIEGLFLSSGIIRSADYTMEQVVNVARRLREQHHFRGYIHLKTIPEADEALLDLVYSYTEARPPKGAIQYFEKLSDSRATFSLALDKLGNRYFVKSLWQGRPAAPPRAPSTKARRGGCNRHPCARQKR